MNQTQFQTTVAPLVAAVAGFLAGKGVFGFDVGTWITVLGGVGTIGAAVWGGLAARKTALASTLGNYHDTTVVTDKATADALPTNSSVVSNTEVRVVNK
jgi:hypothetical protein